MSLVEVLGKELLGTDAGLLSLGVIGFVVVMAVWLMVYVRRRM